MAEEEKQKEEVKKEEKAEQPKPPEKSEKPEKTESAEKAAKPEKSEKPASDSPKKEVGKKISQMTLPEVEAALKMAQEKMGGFQSAFARDLLARRDSLLNP